MGSLYEKQNKLWARYKDESGKWSNMPTPYRPGDEPKARRFLLQLEARGGAKRDASAAGADDPAAPLTVEAYARKWLQGRKAMGLASHHDDATRLTLHVLPRLGSMLLEEVRPRHVRDLVLALRQDGKLAPRTIHHVF